MAGRDVVRAVIRNCKKNECLCWIWFVHDKIGVLWNEKNVILQRHISGF